MDVIGYESSDGNKYKFKDAWARQQIQDIWAAIEALQANPNPNPPSGGDDEEPEEPEPEPQAESLYSLTGNKMVIVYDFPTTTKTYMLVAHMGDTMLSNVSSLTLYDPDGESTELDKPEGDINESGGGAPLAANTCLLTHQPSKAGRHVLVVEFAKTAFNMKDESLVCYFCRLFNDWDKFINAEKLFTVKEIYFPSFSNTQLWIQNDSKLARILEYAFVASTRVTIDKVVFGDLPKVNMAQAGQFIATAMFKNTTVNHLVFAGNIDSASTNAALPVLNSNGKTSPSGVYNNVYFGQSEALTASSWLNHIIGNNTNNQASIYPEDFAPVIHVRAGEPIATLTDETSTDDVRYHARKLYDDSASITFTVNTDWSDDILYVPAKL